MIHGRREARRWPATLLVAGVVAIAGCDDQQESQALVPPPSGGGDAQATDRSDTAITEPHTMYVPAYGTVRTSDKNRATFAITLSIRNIDPEASVTLARVDYFDTPGHRVRSFLSERRVLRPLETVELFVPADDQSNASGANFMIGWEGPRQARALLAESIMVGYSNGSYVTFTSRGIQLDAPPASEDLPPLDSSAAAPTASTTPER